MVSSVALVDLQVPELGTEVGTPANPGGVKGVESSDVGKQLEPTHPWWSVWLQKKEHQAGVQAAFQSSILPGDLGS